MDAVYPYNHKSLWEYKEIGYSIKSLRKFTTIDKIFTVGDDIGQIHLPYNQTQHPAVNIWEKCLHACKDDRVSDPFLFISDDHYFIKQVDIETYPNYYYFDMEQYPYLHKTVPGGHSYWDLVTKTYNLLGNVLFFNVHCPVIIHKQRLYDIYRKYQDELYTGLGLLFKTTYLNGLPGVQMDDYKTKVNEPYDSVKLKCKDRHVFSTCDIVSGGVRQFLSEILD